MDEVEVEVRRWGNSLGVIIPAEAARRQGLQPHDKVRIRVSKITYPDPSFFGSARHLKIDARAFKEELRRDHDL
jgi:antitoxin component of MazEF toxin-antitoxin module